MSALQTIEKKWGALGKPQKVAVIGGGVALALLARRFRGKGSAATTAAGEPMTASASSDYLGGSSGSSGGSGGSGGTLPDPGTLDENDPGTLDRYQDEIGKFYQLPAIFEQGAAPTTTRDAAVGSPIPPADSFGLPYGSAGYFGNGGESGEGGIWGTLGYSQAVIDAGGTVKTADGSTNAFLQKQWDAANSAQKASQEFVDSLNSVNREAGFGDKFVRVAPAAPYVPVAASPVIQLPNVQLSQPTAPPAVPFQAPTYDNDRGPVTSSTPAYVPTQPKPRIETNSYGERRPV